MPLRHPNVPLGVRRAVLGATAVSLTFLGLTTSSYAAPPTSPFISEIHYDNAGTDTGEFVEVQLPAGTTSAGLSVMLYNGSGGASYDKDPVPTVTAPADAPAVVVVSYPSNGIQNGSPDGSRWSTPTAPSWSSSPTRAP